MKRTVMAIMSVLFLSAFSLLLLSSCSGQAETCESDETLTAKEASEDYIMYKDDTKVYSYEEITEFVYYPSSLVKFCSHFGVESFRIIDFGSTNLKGMNPNAFGDPWYYTVVNTEKNPLLVIFRICDKVTRYDETLTEGAVDSIDIAFSKGETEEKLISVKEGTKENEVFEIDPDGRYELSEGGYIGPEAFHKSFHFFENGNAYIVIYSNDDNVVKDVLRLKI